jgi:hypothetical protein
LRRRRWSVGYRVHITLHIETDSCRRCRNCNTETEGRLPWSRQGSEEGR